MLVSTAVSMGVSLAFTFLIVFGYGLVTGSGIQASGTNAGSYTGKAALAGLVVVGAGLAASLWSWAVEEVVDDNVVVNRFHYFLSGINRSFVIGLMLFAILQLSPTAKGFVCGGPATA